MLKMIYNKIIFNKQVNELYLINLVSKDNTIESKIFHIIFKIKKTRLLINDFEIFRNRFK